jgi:hypothetical protein
VLVLHAFRAGAQANKADVFVARAVIDLDDRRYKDAIRSLQGALQIEPDHLEALYHMGVAHLAIKRPADGVTFLERARARLLAIQRWRFSSAQPTSPRGAATGRNRSWRKSFAASPISRARAITSRLKLKSR